MATAENGEIFWIEDLRISERFKIDAHSARYLELRWKRLPRNANTLRRVPRNAGVTANPKPRRRP
jgi:hypothetical protein